MMIEQLDMQVVLCSSSGHAVPADMPCRSCVFTRPTTCVNNSDQYAEVIPVSHKRPFVRYSFDELSSFSRWLRKFILCSLPCVV